MKKFFNDNNKTAMQFANVIIRDIKDGDLDGSFMDTASDGLYRALKGFHSSSIGHLIEDLVEDATGKEVFVSLYADKPYEEFEVRCQWTTVEGQ